jgi:YD repeat-containing protein
MTKCLLGLSLYRVVCASALGMLAACGPDQNVVFCGAESAFGALGGVPGAVAGAMDAAGGGSTTAKSNPDGSITSTVWDADGNVVSSETSWPSYPGPGFEGEPAAGPVDSGRRYGKSFLSPDGSGRTEILDRDGKVIGCKFFGPPEPPRGPDGALLDGDEWDGVPHDGAIRWKADGTKQILDGDGNVIAELPPVDPEGDFEDTVKRDWVPLPDGGGYWVAFDADGRVVDIDHLPPGPGD